MDTNENIGRRSDTARMVKTKIKPDHETACYLTFYSEDMELVYDLVFNII